MSEQLDERLRTAARTYRRLGNHTAEGMFLEAADTITELQDENAKLREQIHWLKQGDILHVLTDQEYIDQCERERLMQVSIDALDKENAKLRDLVRDMFEEIEAGGFDPMVERHGKNTVYYEEDQSWRVGIRERMRELGIEVEQ